jgi:hypothetical protein
MQPAKKDRNAAASPVISATAPTTAALAARTLSRRGAAANDPGISGSFQLSQQLSTALAAGGARQDLRHDPGRFGRLRRHSPLTGRFGLVLRPLHVDQPAAGLDLDANASDLPDLLAETPVCYQLSQFDPGLDLLGRRIVRQIRRRGPAREPRRAGIQSVENLRREVIDDLAPLGRGQACQLVDHAHLLAVGRALHHGGHDCPAQPQGPDLGV